MLPAFAMSRRGFVLILTLCVAYIAFDTGWRVTWYNRISNFLPDGPPGLEARRRIVPANAQDGLYWVEYAQRMATTGEWRIREMDMDNAPFGRQQHWHSGFAWWLVALGWMKSFISGTSPGHGIELMAAYANPLLLICFLLGFSILAARRFGFTTGACLAIAMVCSHPLVSSFAANEPGHHGLDSAASLGTILFLLMGGFGFARQGDTDTPLDPPSEARARRWFMLSAICGGFGLWFSALTLIQVFVGAALGAMIASLLIPRPSTRSALYYPQLWRLWGRTGALLSLGFYLLEYFPNNLGLRLEVNSPVYAFAWWGGGELLHEFFAWRAGGAFWPEGRTAWIRWNAAILSLALPPLLILIGGVKWCCLRDPIQWRIVSVVSEGLPVWKMGLLLGWPDFIRYISVPVLILLLGLATAFSGRLTRLQRTQIVCVLGALLPLLASSVLHNRWIMICGAVTLATVVASVTALPLAFGPKTRLMILGLLGMAWIGILPAREIKLAWNWFRNPELVLPTEASYPFFMRHVAQTLRQNGGSENDVVLASPNDSAMLIYFGHFRGLGTLYWENNDGMRATAALYAVEDDETARRMIAARGIRYLVASSDAHFIEGYNFLATGKWDKKSVQRSFVSRVFSQGILPVWLRPIPMPPAPGLQGKQSARVFEYVPNQSPAEFWFYSAEANFTGGHYAQALRSYQALNKLRPATAPDLVKIAMAFAELGQPKDAEAAFAKAAEMAPNAPWTQLHFELAGHYQGGGEYRYALEHLEAAVKLTPTNAVCLNNLAWLLATAPAESLRNGTRAVQVAWSAAQAQGTPSAEFYDTLAAAQAESGDFTQAISTASQALALARQSRKAELAAEIQARLAKYQQGMPFRLPPKAPKP